MERTEEVQKVLATLKESVRAIKDLEVELTRKGVLTTAARNSLNSAAADLGVYVIGLDPTSLSWVLSLGAEYAEKNEAAHAEALGNLTADQAERFNKYVAEAQDKLRGDQF